MPEPERKAVRSSIEIDGAQWVVWRRPSELTDGHAAVSFDGETFHEKGVDAYIAAKKAGKLLPAGAETEAADLPEDAAAAMLELVRLIAALRPGEELRVFHAGSSLNVSRSKLVASFRPSTFEGTGIEPAIDEEV